MALGFDRIHFYNMMGDRASPDTRAVLARYVAPGYVVNHDWSMAANPGPLWANPKAERQAVVMSAGAASVWVRAAGTWRVRGARAPSAGDAASVSI